MTIKKFVALGVYKKRPQILLPNFILLCLGPFPHEIRPYMLLG